MGLPDVILESIEPRRLFAVTVVEHADFVEIVGDSSPDRIAISVRDRQLRVVSDNQTRTVRFPGTKSLRISAGAGDDIIRIDQTRVFGSISIDGGAGDDLISLTSVRMSGPLSAQGGEGNDTLRFERLTVNAGVGVILEAGHDRATFWRGRFSGNLDVLGRKDRNSVTLRSTTVGGKLHIRTGDSTDSITLRDVSLANRGLIETGGRQDTVRIARSHFRKPLRVDQGEDSDDVYREVWHATSFSDGLDPWKTEAAGYPKGQITAWDGDGRPIVAEENYELSSGLTRSPLDNKTVLLLSGRNNSDDLMMFAWRAFGPEDGVIANQRYRAFTEIALTTSTPNDSQFLPLPHRLFFGALSIQPEVRLTPDGYGLPRLVGNDGIHSASFDQELQVIVRSIQFDIDNNSSMVSGTAPSFVFVPKLPRRTGPWPYSLVSRAAPRAVEVRADQAGNVWIVAGIDSEYETKFVALINSIRVVLEPISTRELS